MAFGSTLLQGVGGFFKAHDDDALAARRRDVVGMLSRLESGLTGAPYFSGESFSLVDAVFAPVFRYFDAFATMESYDFFAGLTRVPAWKKSLLARPSVAHAVPTDFLPKLIDYLSTRDSALARQQR
jgi:glutathione S-transferase